MWTDNGIAELLTPLTRNIFNDQTAFLEQANIRNIINEMDGKYNTLMNKLTILLFQFLD